MKQLVALQESAFKSVGENTEELFQGAPLPKLNLMAMENCLCEISKYLRWKRNGHQPKQLYHPGKWLALPWTVPRSPRKRKLPEPGDRSAPSSAPDQVARNLGMQLTTPRIPDQTNSATLA